MTEKINKQKRAKRRSGLRIGLAAGMIMLVGLITLSGCNRNGANSNANSNINPSPGTVVKNSGGMEFAYVPPGNFQMGSESGDTRGSERPVHKVTFASGFYIGRYEVTQAQWQKVMGNNPSFSNQCGENCPVERTSWDDVQEFIKKLNAMNDGYTYRLPSEAEWEYACRAGTTGDYAGDLDAMAWHRKNSNNVAHAVGQKQPNAWGLYDMHGSASEWMMDNYHGNYDGAPTDGSAWLGGVWTERVVRGGSSFDDGESLRSAYRNRYSPNERTFRVGLRLVAVLQSK